MSPEEIVEAIWAHWEKYLDDWDLEGSTANLRARRLAYEVLAEALTPDQELCVACGRVAEGYARDERGGRLCHTDERRCYRDYLHDRALGNAGKDCER